MSAPTHSEQLQRLVQEYRACGEAWPATARQIAAWAVRKRLWAPPHDTLVGQCAEQLSRAMREEYIQDPQGRSVRAKHAARVEKDGVQMILWDDIRTADRQHMQIAFQQRRQQIVGDCRQLKMDVVSYNENGRPSVSIRMVFDFTDDLEESEAYEAAKRR